MTVSEFDSWFRARFRGTSSMPATVAFVVSDLFGVMFAFGTAFLLLESYGWIVLHDRSFIDLKSFVTYWPYLPIFILVFWIFGMYPGIWLAPSEELRRFFVGSFVAFGGVAVSRFMESGGWDSVNTAFTTGAFFSTVTLLVVRNMAHIFIRKAGFANIPAIIYGNGKTARLVIDNMLNSKKAGYVPVLILDDETGGEEEYNGIPVIHDISMGRKIAESHRIRMAVVAMDGKKPHELKRLLNHSASTFRYRVIIPDFFDGGSVWMSVRELSGFLGFSSDNKLVMPWNIGVKRFLDILLVMVGGILILPAMLFIAALVRLTSPGSALYGHERIGKDGKSFRALKFRSMVSDSKERLEELLSADPQAREEWEKNRKLKNDPRVTRLGKFLRRTSLDEFPQFINILKGEMSFVGPRPVTAGEVEKYGSDFAWIFSATPGLTGMWQVSGRSETDYAERVFYDTYYLQNWSVWLDLWIIYKTFGAVLNGKGAY